MIVYREFNKGRIGNQLFFIASTIGIAIKNKTSYGFYSKMGYGGVDYQSIFENDLPITDYVPPKTYTQQGFGYYDIEIDDVELIGYYQSEKFFIHCADIIKKQFSFKKNVMDFVSSQYPEHKECMGIHIRRGDYVDQPNHHPVLPIDYYNKVIENNKNQNKKVFVFSDDREWVKSVFVGDNFIFPHFSENDDLYSFVLLSMMKDIAISNSTFSWWAAWLSEDNNKIIYAPPHKSWFGPMYSNLETKDIIPERWIKINF